MAAEKTPDGKKVHLFPPPSKDFDPFAATEKDLMRHGLPLRPDPQTQPGMAALWERQAARYRSFDHLEPQPDTATAAKKAIIAPALGPDPIESCGYQLFSTSAPFTALFVTWTVPDLHFTPSSVGVDYFHTFVGLGFLDVHVEMTVDSAQNVTSQIWAQSIGQVNLPVRPGDVISGSLCLQTNQAGTASYFLANETTSQTINFTVETGFPPAVTINAGVTRSWSLNQPFPPLASFGVVYFDEISAYTTSGPQSLTSGQAITMVDQNGRTLARPVRLTDFTFKTVFVSA
ncbi:MAG TPA: G1 family glutamic endopeptidase [Acidobacteriaceae bacterium]